MKYQKILNITFLLFSLLLIGCKIQEVSGEVKRVDTKYESLIIDNRIISYVCRDHINVIEEGDFVKLQKTSGECWEVIY